MGSLYLILITRRPAPPAKTVARARAAQRQPRPPGLQARSLPPVGISPVPSAPPHLAECPTAPNVPRYPPWEPSPRRISAATPRPARTCAAPLVLGLRPVGLQLGCARTDSYIKPGILRQ